MGKHYKTFWSRENTLLFIFVRNASCWKRTSNLPHGLTGKRIKLKKKKKASTVYCFSSSASVIPMVAHIHALVFQKHFQGQLSTVKRFCTAATFLTSWLVRLRVLLFTFALELYHLRYSAFTAGFTKSNVQNFAAIF